VQRRKLDPGCTGMAVSMAMLGLESFRCRLAGVLRFIRQLSLLRLVPRWVRARVRRHHGGWKYACDSANHRKWLAPALEAAGLREEEEGWRGTAAVRWTLRKRVLPDPVGAAAFNCLPQLQLLDDKALLALLCRSFSRTAPLVTHVIYGEWDAARLAALRERWGASACDEPRWFPDRWEQGHGTGALEGFEWRRRSHEQDRDSKGLAAPRRSDLPSNLQPCVGGSSRTRTRRTASPPRCST